VVLAPPKDQSTTTKEQIMTNARVQDNETTITISGIELEIGDWVKVEHAPGKRDGFTGKLAGWWVEEGIVTAIDVWGGKTGREKMRSVRTSRVTALKKQPTKKKEPK
jgi:hypothetical protein